MNEEQPDLTPTKFIIDARGYLEATRAKICNDPAKAGAYSPLFFRVDKKLQEAQQSCEGLYQVVARAAKSAQEAHGQARVMARLMCSMMLTFEEQNVSFTKASMEKADNLQINVQWSEDGNLCTLTMLKPQAGDEAIPKEKVQ